VVALEESDHHSQLSDVIASHDPNTFTPLWNLVMRLSMTDLRSQLELGGKMQMMFC
jgi:hypothetical protein